MTLNPVREISHVRFHRRLAGFAGLPLLAVLTPFLLMPILARLVSKDVWSSIGIGQSVGGFAAIAASFGWPLRGPALIARSDAVKRTELYVESLVTRLCVFVLSMPFVLGIVTILTPDKGRVIGIGMAVAISLGALSPVWYNIGEGRASDVALYDVLPRMAATAVSAAALVILREPIVYPVLLGVFAIAGIAAFTRRVCGKALVSRMRDVSLTRAIREGTRAALTVTAGGAYSSSDVAIVGIDAPISSHSAYVSGSKVYGMGLLSVVSLANALQGWVAEVAGHRARARMKTAVVAHTLLGLVGAMLIGFFGPVATRVLYGEDLEAPKGTMVCFGAAFLFVSVNTAIGRLVLIPLHQHSVVLLSTLVGAAVGVPLLVVGGAVAGSEGGALGLAVSQLIVLTVQFIALARYLGHH